MSQRDNFSSGFFLGALLGGVVGGLVGVILSTPNAQEESEVSGTNPEEGHPPRPRKRPLRLVNETVTEQSIEAARQGLEQKIAQLNEAIDDVRQQISQVHTQNEQTPQKFTS
jgi:cell division protein FtsN